ncbi:MAG: TonB-dependent receptor plug domain-containing protein [Erythrobacter sp.]|uniref:TonB-dependent receptor plug domain-containing protein n=1 Tax=Erythrobacter sp. TaxID=1042 RepID=UPI00260E9721|nr:TonB-dependent receptor plug domain-containing protein [Erythrobacter sp.]MDJ0977135.1 TonB-dependent receptor plug domain-containing protein [Erythrobacter sp.]
MSINKPASTSAFLALAVALTAAPTGARAAETKERQVSAQDSAERGEEMEDKAGGTVARRSYTPDDFARFAPRSALDMARQVPGFQIREGDGARGLGQADTNVLINGRRISGKSNGPVAALQRIPTEEVLRLELVDGATLDIGGLTGQVLNVITSGSGSVSGQYRYAPQIRTFGTDPRLLEGRVAIAGGGAKTDWTLAFENDSGRFGDEGPELVFDGAGNLVDTRDEQREEDRDRFGLSGSYTRLADNGNVLNLTGEVNGFLRRETEISERSGSIDPVDRTREFEDTEDEFNFEVGADYQFALGPGKLKLIGYHRYEDSPTVSTQVTSFADGSDAVGTRFTRDADEGETIARAEYSFPAFSGDLLIAGEGVRNFLDINSTLKELDAAGEFVPVELEGATSRVDEDRAELQGTYSRALASNLQFQLSLAGEYSRISQSGAQGQTRTFYRPKGFVALDWKVKEGVNIAARLERLVGQLNFFDFIASVDLDQDRTDVTNADLVPQQSWRLEVEANIGLGDVGTLNLRPFYEDIVDIVDQIPIEGGGQAPGNLPSAQLYGVETDLTLLSEGLGWRGTRVDVSLALQGSSVRDPLLGTTRELSNNQIVDVGFDLRHDLPGTSWAFGGDFNWDYNADNVRLDEISVRNDSFAFAGVFLENKDVRGATLRLAISNVLDRDNRFERTVFVDRAAGIVDFSETRERNFGTIITFEIEGSF